MHGSGRVFLGPAATDPQEDIADGDAFRPNAPYLGNTPPADHVILVPVIWEGVHLFTTAAKAQQRSEARRAGEEGEVPGVAVS